MKRILFITVFFILVYSFALGQVKSKSDTTQNAQVEHTLMQIEKELTDDLVKGGTSAFERCLDDSYIFIGDDGTATSRAEFIALLKSGDLKYESSNLDQIKVRVYHDAAVAIFRSTDKYTYKGEDQSGSTRWTDVFIKQSGTWMLVSSHGTKIVTK